MAQFSKGSLFTLDLYFQPPPNPKGKTGNIISEKNENRLGKGLHVVWM